MQPTILNKAVFLDKDGTVIENVPYNVDPALMKLTEGAAEGLLALQNAGYLLFVISNQAGVAQGKFSEEALLPVQQRMKEMLGEVGVTLSGFYYCPHHPKGRLVQYSMACFCRKPNPGLLFQAARENQLNLSASWFIGDILNDVECGRRADCRTVLINNGNETEWKLSALRQPHFTVPNLLEAAQVILAADAQPAPALFIKKQPENRPVAQPAAAKPAVRRPAASRPANTRPNSGRPAVGRPATRRPSTPSQAG